MKNRHLAQATWTVLALTVAAVGSSFDARSADYEGSASGATRTVANGAVTWDWYRKQIEEQKITSIEEALRILPENYRAKYTLMFKSRSLHQSSFRDPRVLMYGPDATFIISFNGDPSQRGFQAVETMEFDRGTSRFLYREIHFPDKAGGLVHFSEPNPDKCTKCHGVPTRPIWDSTPSWPGAYGEIYLNKLSTTERSQLNQFVEYARSHPRYQYLAHLEAGYAKEETFRPSQDQRYNGEEQLSPNAQMNNLLAVMNFKEILAEIRALPDFPKLQYALLGALDLDCGAISQFFPEELQEQVETEFKALRKDSRRLNVEQRKLKKYRLHPENNTYGTTGDTDEQEEATRFRMLAESVLGVSTRAWTMELEKETFNFSAIGKAFKNIEDPLLDLINRTEPKLRPLASVRGMGTHEKYCNYLQKQSRAALKGIRFTAIASDPNASRRRSPAMAGGQPALLTKCIGCHQNGPAPHIPFADPHALTQALNAKRSVRGTLLEEILWRLSPEAGLGRMPFGMNASDEDRKEVELYVQKLAQKKR